MPAPLAVLIITPPPCFIMCGIAYLHPKNTPFRHTSTTQSHSSSLVSTTVLGTKTPALLNRISRRPNPRTVSSTMRSTSAATRTSTETDFATPPAFSISAAVLLADSDRTSATITFAPSRANRSALARPIPEPAPVISATLSLSSMMVHLRRRIVFRQSTLATVGENLEALRLCGDASQFARAPTRWLRDRKIALVREIREMALDCRGVTPAFATGKNMNSEHRKRQIDKQGSPSNIRRIDS